MFSLQDGAYILYVSIISFLPLTGTGLARFLFGLVGPFHKENNETTFIILSQLSA